MRVQLRPSFLRSSAWVASTLLAFAAITYFWQGYRENHWWTRDYVLSLLVPLLIGPVMVWFMFVPSQLAFSDSEFIIKFPFRAVHTLSWSELKYYGAGNNVFMIQFTSAGTFQIFPQAFPRREWRMLKSFLSSTFPEKKASGYIGDRMFKWPWRKA